MPTIIDEDVIRQKAVSDEYRDGWERTFGDKNAESESKDCDAISVVINEIKNRKCECDLRDRRWNGYAKCLNCGGRYD